jgi:DNA invertase Pin-like site-specific DNA recombinase
MRAVIYTRASLDRTGEGKSNSRQREECLRLADYKRWEVIQVAGQPSVDDVSISAYGDKERPGWQTVLKMIEDGEVDVVIAWHLDRLTRNMADLETLIVLCEKHDVAVTTATGDMDLTNDTGRMVARILAAVARQEVERKAARQRLQHAQRRAEGKPWKAVKMLGYERDGRIIEKEAAAIRQAMEDVIEERASLAELGRRWLELGLTSPYKDDDKPWTPRGVKKILTNPRLAGMVVHNGEVLGRGQWDPIVDENTLTMVVAKLSASERYNGAGKRGPLPSNLLTGIMTCFKCDGTVRAGSARGVLTYQCPEWHTTVPRAEADEVVRSAFAATIALTSPGAVLEAPVGQVDLGDLAERVARLRERQGVLLRSYTDEHITEEQYRAAVQDLSEKIKVLEAEAGGEEMNWSAFRAESVRNFLTQSVTEQRRVLERLTLIKLHPAGRGPRDARRQVEVLVKGKRGTIPAHLPVT